MNYIKILKYNWLLGSLLVTQVINAQVDQSSTVILPVKNHSQLKWVECLVNDNPVEFIFDTGASSTTMSNATFLELIKQGLQFEYVEEKSFTMANGSTSSADIYKSGTFSIGGHRLEDVTFAVIKESNAPNLLGQNVFGRFDSYIIHENHI